jgi:hypothetical protein
VVWSGLRLVQRECGGRESVRRLLGGARLGCLGVPQAEVSKTAMRGGASTSGERANEALPFGVARLQDRPALGEALHSLSLPIVSNEQIPSRLTSTSSVPTPAVVADFC